MKPQWILAILISTFLFTAIELSVCFAGGEYKKTPLSKKFDISLPNKSTDLLVHVSHEDNYSFRLIFKYKNEEEREKVSKLMRGKDTRGRQTYGEKTPISIDVYTVKEGQDILVSTGGGESFLANPSGLGYSKLVYNDYLMAGDYRVVVNSKEGNPMFKNIDVELHVGKAHRPK